jgi:hypothetical protein
VHEQCPANHVLIISLLLSNTLDIKDKIQRNT